MSKHDGPVRDASAPEKWFPLFGLVVVRKADALAAAFLLAAWATGIQVLDYIRGARPQIFHPDTVYVFFDRYANNVIATRVAGQISFTNSGAQGHGAIIRDVAATIEVGGQSIEEHWQSFALVTRAGTAFQADPKEAARPLVVEGGSASSQTVTFSPRVVDCTGKTPCNTTQNYVSDVQFLNLLKKDEKISIKFAATIFDTTSVCNNSCEILITDDFIKTLAENDWYAASCV
jgi:hypothetical protein